MNFDVIIIGAGLAGLQCARQIAAAGGSVMLVDRKADLTKGVHTTGIFVRKTFEDFDFPAGTLGRPIRDVRLYSPALKPLKLTSSNDEFRVGRMGRLYECGQETAFGDQPAARWPLHEVRSELTCGGKQSVCDPRYRSRHGGAAAIAQRCGGRSVGIQKGDERGWHYR
jgi:glycine/D-amino acid oxidase-like deaminating enzyme